MNQSSVVFGGAFTINGGTKSYNIKGSFTISWEIKLLTVERYGYIEKNPDDISITGIFGVSGKITENIGNLKDNQVPNATITVWKDGFIEDKTKTDVNGDYTIFVPSGVYDIEISGGNIKRTISNCRIDGITEVYCLPKNGDIFEKYYDCVSFLYKDEYGTISYHNDWLVNGEILDKANKPVKDAEIVVSVEDEVTVYKKTDETGQYHFLLPRGTYDVKIKLPNQHAKIAKDVVFGGRNGFIPSVIQQLGTVR